jgi:hypothetical protein
VEINLRRRKISMAPVVGVSEALRETAAAWLDIETSTHEALRKDAAATLLHAETKNEMGIVKKCHEELQVFYAQKHGIVLRMIAYVPSKLHGRMMRLWRLALLSSLSP